MGKDINWLVKGCCVSHGDKNEFGIVIRCEEIDGFNNAFVRWNSIKKETKSPINNLRNGFKIGMEVQDVPLSRTRSSLGEGVVIETRTIGNRDQILVEFLESGEKHWIPFQNLKLIKGVFQRFMLSDTGKSGNAERFRLRSLAYAIETWNENTGALSHLHIDPLPHQINLVHHILKSGNLNWLIADDVGLGKTIETGMLLSALIHRNSFRRILLVTPAGLVQQWKDELHHKFGMSDFQIYGEDFHIKESRHWKLYDHVIASVDRLKSDKHFTLLMESDYWDIIVFDEAHNLSRMQYGMTFESTGRFRLAAALRKKTDSIVLLTATPHQGKTDKFQALLEILRPENKKIIRNIASDPEVISQMVYRNNKSDVTDTDGNKIFKGKISKSIRIDLSEEEILFEKELIRYLRQGYLASKEKGGMKGRAIGFVMTIYRKLAASSIAAIKNALSNRMDRLNNEIDLSVKDIDYLENSDRRFEGEIEEHFDNYGSEFFKGEKAFLLKLIDKANQIIKKDNKIVVFMNEVIAAVKENNPDEKIVIFTEYIASQNYLYQKLCQAYGKDSVALINGSVNYEHRQLAIEKFEDSGQFLISTEAGGEGINLHRKCHILINFDLPWNPMRIVQRIGRLYRYGQVKKVVVFNIYTPQSLDGNIVALLYERIDQVVQDMAILGGEFKPGLESEILGEITDSIEIGNILENSLFIGAEQTEKDIENAVQHAKDAVEMQRELMGYAAGYNPETSFGELKISRDHLKSFAGGMFKHLGVEIIEKTHKEDVWEIVLPNLIKEELSMRGSHMKISFIRDIASRRKDIVMMDFDNHFFRYLINYAKDYSFDGRVAYLSGLKYKAVVTAMLRWQNDQGVRMRQEYFTTLVKEDGAIEESNQIISKWLLNPAEEIIHNGKPSTETGHVFYNHAQKAMDLRLFEICNKYLHPENRQAVSAGWCVDD